MSSIRDIHISDFDYPLTEERIAKFPLPRRDASKLLVYRGGEMSSSTFAHLADYLEEGQLMVFNNTRVIQARLHFHKTTGANIEIFLLEPSRPAQYELMFATRGSCEWLCMVGNLKKWKGESLSQTFQHDGKCVSLVATYCKTSGTSHLIRFQWDADITWAEVIDNVGELPIPPYLNRKTQEADKITYQTIYSKIKGSVAAPTAGLHFTPEVLLSIDHRHISREEITLHVGAGTFRPVKSEDVSLHTMHAEYISVARSTIEALLAHQGQAIAVGTTTVRTLESLYYIGLKLHNHPHLDEDQLQVEQWEPYDTIASLSVLEALTEVLHYFDRHNINVLHTQTRIIIVPGYEYKIVNRLITNFHQPKSTLLLLVSAFIGDDWRRVYDYALAHDYRFLSYGDACLFAPSKK